MRLPFSGLRSRVLILLLLAVIPAFALFVYTASDTREHEAKQARTDTLRFARAIATQRDQLTRSTRQLLTALAQWPQVRSQNAIACNVILSELMAQYPLYANLAAVDAQGNVFCSAVPLTEAVNLADRLWFRRAVATRDFSNGEYQTGGLTYRPTYIYADPVFDSQGNLLAIVYAAIDLIRSNPEIAATELPLGSTITLLDSEGTILARYPDPEKWIGQTMPPGLLAQSVLTGSEGTLELRDEDGVERLYAFTSVASMGEASKLFVTIGIPAESVLGPANLILSRNLLAMGMASFLALVAAWVLGDWFIRRPVNALLNVAQRVTAGDLSARVGTAYGTSELGELARSFDQMAAALQGRDAERQRAESALHQTVAELQAVFRALPDLYFRLDYDGRVLDVLAGQVGDLYRPREQILNQSMHKILPAPVERQVAEAIVQVHATQSLVTIEYALDVPSGNQIFEARFLPLPGDQIIVVVRNITERRRAEQAEREQQTLAEALRDTAAALNSTLDFDAVLDRILENVGRVVAHDAANVMLIEGASARVVRSQGYAERGLAAQVLELRLQVSEMHYLNQIVQTHRPIAVADTLTASHWIEFGVSSWIRSWVCAPIQVKGRVIGFLNVDSAAPNFFDTTHAVRLQAFADQAAIALENARLLAETERRAEQLALLYDAGLALNSVLEPRTQLEFLFKIAMRTLRADRVEFFRVDTPHGEIVYELGVGYTRAALESLGTLRARLGDERFLFGSVAHTRTPLNLPDVRVDPRYVAFDPAIVSGLWVPVQHEDRVLGVLAVFSTRPSAFEAADERMFTLFANQAAIALENGRLFAELQSSLQMTQRLYQLSTQILAAKTLDETARLLVRTLRDSFGAISASLQLFDAHQRTEFKYGEGLPLSFYTNFQPEPNGFTMQAIRSGEPVIIDDLARMSPHAQAQGIQTTVILPLHGETHNLGVVFLDFPSPRRFESSEIELLSLFANQAALAVERVRMQSEMQHRIRELEVVNRVSTALRSAETLDQMLPILLDEILVVLDARHGCIYLYDPVEGVLRTQITREWHPVTLQHPQEGITGLVFTTGQPYVSREFCSDPRLRPAARDRIAPGWGGVHIPIRTGQDIVGVLALGVELPREIAPDEVALLLTLTEIAGSALHRARLHAQTQQQLEHLTALRQVDLAITNYHDLARSLNVILSQAVLQLPVDAASILLLDAATRELVFVAERGLRVTGSHPPRLPLDASFAGRAVRQAALVAEYDLPHAASPALVGDTEFVRVEGWVSYIAVPLIARGQVKGILEVFHRTRLQPDPERLEFMDMLAGQAAMALDNAELFESLQGSNADLVQAYDATLEGWSHALDLRDRETEGHTQRVTELTLRLARAMGLPEKELVHIRRGALLHDIGKIAVPDQILSKPGPFTTDERAIMNQHPVHAREFLAPIAYLRPALDIPYCHHERWDGWGYPRGLKGEAIPLAARLFAVVDVYDALWSDRPYRPAWPETQVCEYLRDQAGKQFDPEAVRVFLEMLDSSRA